MQINPDVMVMFNYRRTILWFQSYQFMQINPDIAIIVVEACALSVSIVSIHADQSRLGKKEESWKKDRWVSIVSIHADQSRQVEDKYMATIQLKFQSYQFMQINPDGIKTTCHLITNEVSIVSIHADQSRPVWDEYDSFAAVLFQSYQFMQINPDANCLKQDSDN